MGTYRGIADTAVGVVKVEVVEGFESIVDIDDIDKLFVLDMIVFDIHRI